MAKVPEEFYDSPKLEQKGRPCNTCPYDRECNRKKCPAWSAWFLATWEAMQDVARKCAE